MGVERDPTDTGQAQLRQTAPEDLPRALVERGELADVVHQQVVQSPATGIGRPQPSPFVLPGPFEQSASLEVREVPSDRAAVEDALGTPLREKAAAARGLLER